MTWSPEQVSEKIEAVCDRLEAAVATFYAVGEESARKTHTAKVEAAKLMLLSGQYPELKTVDQKKAWVAVQLGDLELEAEIAAHHTVAQREVIRSLASEADLLRTLAASHRQMSSSPGW